MTGGVGAGEVDWGVVPHLHPLCSFLRGGGFLGFRGRFPSSPPGEAAPAAAAQPPAIPKPSEPGVLVTAAAACVLTSAARPPTQQAAQTGALALL